MESAFNSAELESYDRYWDSISVEKTIWYDARKEGKVEERDEIVGRAYKEPIINLKLRTVSE